MPNALLSSVKLFFDYDPFGMITQGRNWEAGSGYRYGFNGKEQDNEAYGNGNIYDYGFRIFNPRLGRFLSVDPLTNSFPWYSPYQFAGNKPILNIDLDGLEDVYYDYKKFDKENPGLLPILDIAAASDVVIDNKNVNMISDFTNPSINNTWNALIIEIPDLQYGTANTSYIYFEVLTDWYSEYNNAEATEEQKQMVIDAISTQMTLSSEEAKTFIQSEAVSNSISQKRGLLVTWLPVGGNNKELGDGTYDQFNNLKSGAGDLSILVLHEVYHWWTLFGDKSRVGGSDTKGPLDHAELYDSGGSVGSIPTNMVKILRPESLMARIINSVENVVLQKIASNESKED